MTEISLLVSGDRFWDDRQGLEDTLDAVGLGITRLIHGGARGADTLASDWAKARDIRAEPFRADWRRYRGGAGPIRNREMLAEKPDLVIAFHDNLETSSKGTLDCVTEARRRAIPVWHVFHPRTSSC